MSKEENALVTFFSKHWATCFVALAIAASLCFFYERSRTSSGINAKKDFIVAKQIFDRFHGGEPLSTETIETFEEILTNRPQLHGSYDYALAHCFLWQDNPTKASPYLKATLSRAESVLPPQYLRFAETTLIIAEGNMPNAYMHSKALESELSDASGFETLRALNLLRLATLAKILGNFDEQQLALQTLRALPAFQKISPLYRQGTLSL